MDSPRERDRPMLDASVMCDGRKGLKEDYARQVDRHCAVHLIHLIFHTCVQRFQYVYYNFF